MKECAPTISDSEWMVASVIWEEDGLTSSEIFERLNTSWKLKTVNTFLARLVTKGVLEITRDGRAFRYTALIPRGQCVRAESDSFVKRVFGGAVAPMLAHFCETSDLTDADISELRAILNRKGKTSKSTQPSNS